MCVCVKQNAGSVGQTMPLNGDSEDEEEEEDGSMEDVSEEVEEEEEEEDRMISSNEEESNTEQMEAGSLPTVVQPQPLQRREKAGAAKRVRICRSGGGDNERRARETKQDGN